MQNEILEYATEKIQIMQSIIVKGLKIIRTHGRDRYCQRGKWHSQGFRLMEMLQGICIL